MRLGTNGGVGGPGTVFSRNRLANRRGARSGGSRNGERSTSARRDFAALSDMV